MGRLYVQEGSEYVQGNRVYVKMVEGMSKKEMVCPKGLGYVQAGRGYVQWCKVYVMRVGVMSKRVEYMSKSLGACPRG